MEESLLQFFSYEHLPLIMPVKELERHSRFLKDKQD